MEKEQNHLEEIHKLGIEFAIEGINAEKYKAKSTEEKRVFLSGYKEGLEILNQQQNIDESENVKMAM